MTTRNRASLPTTAIGILGSFVAIAIFGGHAAVAVPITFSGTIDRYDAEYGDDQFGLGAAVGQRFTITVNYDASSVPPGTDLPVPGGQVTQYQVPAVANIWLGGATVTASGSQFTGSHVTIFNDFTGQDAWVLRGTEFAVSEL